MSSTQDSQEPGIRAILDAFANATPTMVPERALSEAHDCREAITPHLQRAVIQMHDLSALGRLQAEGDWRLHSFALHLLAAWRVPGTYDLILKSLTLDDRYDSRWLMGEATSDWPHLLLTTFDGDVERLFGIVWRDDPPWNSDLILCCLGVLTGAHHHRPGDRAAIEAGFEKTLATCEDELIRDSLMTRIAKLKIHSLMPQVWRVIDSPPNQPHPYRLDIEKALQEPWTVDFSDPGSEPNPIVRPREDLLAIICGWWYFQEPDEFVPESPLERKMWERE
ncbi:MAG: DUF1186 domain-containing protein, partial [Verrucomicrobiae bacterium]|nr:DUF1186 domain-containing protein [Verrucomicrobiae bacterium]